MAAQQAALEEVNKIALLVALWDTSERWLRMCLSPSVGADGGGADLLVKILLRAAARADRGAARADGRDRLRGI